MEKFEDDFRTDGAGIFPADGSTASVCLIVGDTAYFANCGDSSVVCIDRSNKIIQVTELHNTSNRAEVRRIRMCGGRVSDLLRFTFARQSVITRHPTLLVLGCSPARAWKRVEHMEIKIHLQQAPASVSRRFASHTVRSILGNAR